MVEIGFDIIGDLYLDPEDSFDWEGKPTSLYCIVSGNISNDLRTIYQTLSHLSRFYQGVLYVPGLLEYKGFEHESRTKEIMGICKKLPKVALLYQHVVVIDNIAIIGANGWNADNPDDIDHALIKDRLDDIAYLNKSIATLQTHLDVKKIVIVTACIPKRQLYFGKIPDHVEDHLYPEYCLTSDTEMKVTHWIFGGVETFTDTVIGAVRYINNPYYNKRPYWPKRIIL